jgi:DNA-binding SARP family transcriptional activator
MLNRVHIGIPVVSHFIKQLWENLHEDHANLGFKVMNVNRMLNKHSFSLTGQRNQVTLSPMNMDAKQQVHH